MNIPVKRDVAGNHLKLYDTVAIIKPEKMELPCHHAEFIKGQIIYIEEFKVLVKHELGTSPVYPKNCVKVR